MNLAGGERFTSSVLLDSAELLTFAYSHSPIVPKLSQYEGYGHEFGDRCQSPALRLDIHGAL